MVTSLYGKCVATVAVAGIATSVAWASPPSNWFGQLIVASHFTETALINSERIKFQTKDPTDTYEVKLTWQANGNSGWHHHPGIILV